MKKEKRNIKNNFLIKNLAIVKVLAAGIGVYVYAVPLFMGGVKEEVKEAAKYIAMQEDYIEVGNGGAMLAANGKLNPEREDMYRRMYGNYLNLIRKHKLNRFYSVVKEADRLREHNLLENNLYTTIERGIK